MNDEYLPSLKVKLKYRRTKRSLCDTGRDLIKKIDCQNANTFSSIHAKIQIESNLHLVDHLVQWYHVAGNYATMIIAVLNGTEALSKHFKT